MFEALGGALWRKQGFDLCYVTPSTGDQGVDVVAIRGAEGVLIQTKSSSVENAKLGWETVKEVVGGEAYYRRRHPGVTFKKIGLTNQYFNTQAQQQAALNGVELFDRDTLEALLDRYPVQLVDLERLLFAEWSDDARTN
jgi:HJR/Mrr/RecB family endonuclease